MDKKGTDENKRSSYAQKQLRLLNVNNLQQEVGNSINQNRVNRLVEHEDTYLNNKKIISKEDTMEYTCTSVLGYRLKDISNVFKETKFIQNVLPTRFTKQDSEANGGDSSDSKELEDPGNSHSIYLV